MHDWRAYVRKQLPPLSVGPQRESAIVAELALQLEQVYSDALAGGVSETDGARRAESQFADWNALAREINAAERPAPQLTERTNASRISGFVQDVRYATRFL